MAPDHPTASITGRHEWTWNQAQSESKVTPAAVTTRTNRPLAKVSSGSDQRGGERDIVPRPDGPLDHNDWRLQQVIVQYERLLDERDRHIEQLENALSEQDGLNLSRVLQFLQP